MGALEACKWEPGRAATDAAATATAGADADATTPSRPASRTYSPYRREVLYINTGGHDGIDAQLQRYKRAGLLRKLERTSSFFGEDCWYEGQWDVTELIEEVTALAAQRSGLVHTRDAGL